MSIRIPIPRLFPLTSQQRRDSISGDPSAVESRVVVFHFPVTWTSLVPRSGPVHSPHIAPSVFSFPVTWFSVAPQTDTIEVGRTIPASGSSRSDSPPGRSSTEPAPRSDFISRARGRLAKRILGEAGFSSPELARAPAPPASEPSPAEAAPPPPQIDPPSIEAEPLPAQTEPRVVASSPTDRTRLPDKPRDPGRALGPDLRWQMVVPKRDRQVELELSSDPDKPASGDRADRDPKKAPRGKSEAENLELVLPQFLAPPANVVGRAVSPAGIAIRIVILTVLLILLYIVVKGVAGFRDDEPARGARSFPTELCRFQEPWFVA